MDRAGKTHSFRQVLAMLQSVVQATRDAIGPIEALFKCVRSRDEAGRRRKESVQARYEITDSWKRDINHLGCEAKGLWLVDRDSGMTTTAGAFPRTRYSLIILTKRVLPAVFR